MLSGSRGWTRVAQTHTHTHTQGHGELAIRVKVSECVYCMYVQTELEKKKRVGKVCAHS